MKGAGVPDTGVAVGLVSAGPGEADFLRGWLLALAGEGVSPLRLMVASPTRSGVEALEAVLRGVPALAAARPVTVSALAQRILERHGHLRGLPPLRGMLHGEQEWLLLSQVLEEVDLPEPLAVGKRQPGFARQCLNFLNWLRANGLGPGAVEGAAPPGSAAGALARVYRAYLDRLKAEGLWGFGDLAPAAARLLRGCPEAARWWQERYLCLGVARCHDLTPAGFDLVGALLPRGVKPLGSRAAPPVALTLDPGLYRARLAAPAWFRARDPWRELLEHLGAGGLAEAPAAPALPAGGGGGAPLPRIRAAGFGRQAEELRWVARELKRLGDAGVAWDGLWVMHPGSEPPPGLEAELRAAGVPFSAPGRRAGAAGLLPGVLAFLAALEDPADDGAVRRWLASALGPGPVFAARAADASRRRGISLLEAAAEEAERLAGPDAGQVEGPPGADLDGGPAATARRSLKLFRRLRSDLEQGARPAAVLAGILEEGIRTLIAARGRGGEGAALAEAWAGPARRLLEAAAILDVPPGAGRPGCPGGLAGLARWLGVLDRPGAAGLGGGGEEAGAAGVPGGGGEEVPGVEGAAAGGPGEGRQGPGRVRVLPLAGGPAGPCEVAFVLDAVADPAPLPPFSLLEPEELRALASALGPLWPPPRLDPASALALEEALAASALGCARSAAYLCWAARGRAGEEGLVPLPLAQRLEPVEVAAPPRPGPKPAFPSGPEPAFPPGPEPPNPPGRGPAPPPAAAPLRGAAPLPCTLPRYLSPSAVKAYLACPRLFYYRCLLGLEEPITAESLLGELVHRALARFFARFPEPGRLGPEAVREEGRRALEQAWAGLGAEEQAARLLGWPARAQALNARAARLLLPYLEAQAAGWEAGRRCVAVEAAVALELGGFVLRGRVDRIDELPSGGHELIDYKSGRGDREAEGRLKAHFLPAGGRRPEDFQLLIYYLAASRGGTLSPVRLAVHQLAHRLAAAPFALRRLEVVPGDPAPSDPRKPLVTGGDLGAGEAALLSVLEEMARGYFPPNPRQPYDCARCAFRLACPRRGGEEEEPGE
ncbi:MAG: PD-(D/E)XK nuclease family protein [Acetobacteraceae bacterium]|nr:PD-(D/E)XK nuclease family protein [Acetobacteraceae bacterium]